MTATAWNARIGTVVALVRKDPARSDEVYLTITRRNPSAQTCKGMSGLMINEVKTHPKLQIRASRGRVRGGLEVKGRTAGRAAAGGGRWAGGRWWLEGEKGGVTRSRCCGIYTQMTSFTPLAAALLRNSNTLTSDPMPPNLGRLDSDTTHVSDSEPEREARRRARHNSHSSTASSAPNSPAPQRMPLSAVSNTLPVAEPAERPALDCRLSAVEGELAEIKVGLAALRSQSLDRATQWHWVPWAMNSTATQLAVQPKLKERKMRGQWMNDKSEVNRIINCHFDATRMPLPKFATIHRTGLTEREQVTGSRTSSGFESGSPPSTPLPKRARIMCHRPVGPDSPVGRLDEPRIHRSSLRVSTPEREEIISPPSIPSHRLRQRKPLVRRVKKFS
ncbi:hypothetical protein DFH09DRAFT_1415059 [Mycena vulgaris]|nr:hypothetical protein DFH09DRAFT_1415059 [Mycena vulgaris]